MSRPGGSGPSVPRVPEDGAALSVRRLKRIAEDGPPVVGTIKRRRGGFAGNDSGLPPSVGFAGGGGRGRGRGRGGSFNHGGGNNANRGGHSHRGGPHRGRGGGGGNNFRGGRGNPGGSRGRGRGRGRGEKGGFRPSGANAEPQTDYYSTGADLYADYADVGTGEESEHGHEDDHEPRCPPPAPRIGRPELTESYRPERHGLPPRPDVRSPGGSPQRSMPPPSSPPRMLPPSTPARPTSSHVILSSSPVAQFHLDSDMVFELASEADHVEHEEVPAHKEKGRERGARKGYGEYTYSPSSPLPDLAATTHDDVSRTLNDSPWNSALGLTTNAAPKTAIVDKRKGKDKEKEPSRPPLPPLEKDDKLAPKPLKIKPMNRNVRKNDPPRPPSLAPPRAKEQARSVSKSPVLSRPPLATSNRSKSPARPPLAASSASTSTRPAASSSSAPLTASVSSSSIINIPAPPPKRAPEPIELSSSPLVPTSSFPARVPRSPEDVKPNLALLAPYSPPPAPAAAAPREGVLALRRADLPTDCFSTDRIRRVPARHIVAQDAKARVVAEGKIVLGTRWRDDGFCVDWQLPARPETDSDDDSDDSSVKFVAAPPRPPPTVIELLDSSEDDEPLARKPKGKRREKHKHRSDERREKSRDRFATPTTATTTTLSPTRSPPPRALARVPSSGTQRVVDSSTLPHDPETPELGNPPLPPLDSDDRDADKWAEYVAANPNGSIVLPFPAKFQKEDSRQSRSYAKWKERQLVLFRTYQSHVASNDVTSAETDGWDAWAPGLRVRWRALSEAEIAAAVEKRKREKRERKEAKKAANEAKEAGRRSASVRASEPRELNEPERRTSAGWVAAHDLRPTEERDELDEEESKDDLAERAARQEKEKDKERKKSDRAERRAMAKQPQDSAPRPSASPAFPPATLPSLPPAATAPGVHSSAPPAQPAQAVGSVPSPPPSPLPPTETSPEDAEIARLNSECVEALNVLGRWQDLQLRMPDQKDIVDAQIERITVQVFSLQEQIDRLQDAKNAREAG